MRRRTALLVLVLGTSLFARDRIAYIEFFGYKGIDAGAVRNALPFREGDQVSRNRHAQARTAVKRVVKRLTGRNATDVAGICCTVDGDTVIFVGLPGASSRLFRRNAPPKGRVRPPLELTALYGKMNQAEDAAFQKGIFDEDGSPGYRLSKEPGARGAELALREYALRHEDEIIRVLESSGNARQRAMAADALGYGAATTRQMAMLVHAARDPDSEVRNNATRALSEILRADASAAAQIVPDTFIDMIRSGIWTDRNKSALVLSPLTRSRDAHLLARLQSEAGDALQEMARWRATGWAYPARVILCRIAGMPEERIAQLAEGSLDAFLSAIGQ
jgi:hypothetical protein